MAYRFPVAALTGTQDDLPVHGHESGRNPLGLGQEFAPWRVIEVVRQALAGLGGVGIDEDRGVEIRVGLDRLLRFTGDEIALKPAGLRRLRDQGEGSPVGINDIRYRAQAQQPAPPEFAGRVAFEVAPRAPSDAVLVALMDAHLDADGIEPPRVRGDGGGLARAIGAAAGGPVDPMALDHGPIAEGAEGPQAAGVLYRTQGHAASGEQHPSQELCQQEPRLPAGPAASEGLKSLGSCVPHHGCLVIEIADRIGPAECVVHPNVRTQRRRVEPSSGTAASRPRGAPGRPDPRRPSPYRA